MIKYTDRITIDPWPFKMYLDNKPIDVNFVAELSEAYNLMCTTEYILGISDYDDDTAFYLAQETLQHMEDYNLSEADAYDEVNTLYKKGEL